jgi:cytochrome c oxidase subunit 2
MIFGWGYVVYNNMSQAPSNAMEIRVIGKQWAWDFQYDDGRVTNGEVFVPINTPVKLVMSSTDVLHSFFIPNFRIKQDVVPGMYTSVWFEAKIPGRHQVFCAEYCGNAHSQMLAHVVVLTPEQWKQWQRGKEVGEVPHAGVGGMKLAKADTDAGKTAEGSEAIQAPKMSALAVQGEKLMSAKGCVACHTFTGETKIGPSYKGIWGHEVELEDGSKVKVDENYIRESVFNPQAKIVKGFQPMMPPYQGQVTEEELNAIIAFIKSLK